MKKIAGVIGCVAIILSITGCKWEIPEKVSVKTDAEYNFALGNLEKDLSSEMNMSDLFGDTNSDTVNIARYDYFPGKEDKNTQHFLVEIKLAEQELVAASAVDAFYGAAPSIDVASTSLSLPAAPSGTMGLDFSPIEIIKSISESIGTDLLEKVSFSNIPLYLYFDATAGLSANVAFDMFYGSRDDTIVERTATRTTMYNNAVTNASKPVYVFEDNNVIISDITKKSHSASVDITDIMNNRDSSIQENDQLCIDYTVSNIHGEIAKADAQNGIKYCIYAIIDLPLNFAVLDDIEVNLSDLANSLNGDSSDSTTEQPSEKSGSSESEFSKYLKVVEGISIKYAAYELPLYVNKKGGMKLGVDMVGRGLYDYADIYTVKKPKKNSEGEKCTLVLKHSTVMKIQELGTFMPVFQLKILKEVKEEPVFFSIPRDRNIDVNLGLSFKTDGIVAVN